jgi:tetratricopeptide (TPR) repeat protein
MELVKGIPLTEYCDQNRLSIGDRLALFRQICSAVQHAHQKGIIHRDLKPSNILVESHDGKPVPKVIDFGLAKAVTGVQLTENTLFTALGTVAGTPLYMAPEQAAFNAIDVDTRADIFALGVILYELLTGSTPIAREMLKKAAFDEVLRAIREQEPPTPSHRLSTSEALPTVAANRQMEPIKLGRFVKGDLDWIVMKALSRERDRRYESATAFAQDIERFLNHEPVSAGPPTIGYKLRKFVKRNKAQVVAGALVLAALVLGITGTTFGLWRAEIALRDEAEQRRIADGERAKADVEKKRAIEFRDKALDALRATTSTDVEKLIGEKKELGTNEKAYLEAIAQRWQTFAKQEGTDETSQAIQAEGYSRVAYLWQRLGRRDEARREYEAARDLQRKLADAYPAVPAYQQGLARTHNNLGSLLRDLGWQDEARREYQAARDLQQRLADAYPAVPEYQRGLARMHNSLAILMANLGRHDEALREFEAARDVQQKLADACPAVPEYQQELARTHNNLGNLSNELGRRSEARREYETARDVQQKLADAYPDVPEYQQELARTHNGLGAVLHNLGRPDEARREYETARELQRLLVNAYPSVPAYQDELGLSYRNFGYLVRDEGKPADSLQWFDLAIRTLKPVHEREPRDVWTKESLRDSLLGRAVAYSQLQKFAEASADFDKAIELSPPIEQGRVRAERAISHVQAGQVAEAIAEVAALTKSDEWRADAWYGFACVYAVASGKIADKKQEYADRAMELLYRAVKAGWKDAAHMAKDTDLDALREREDFKKLLSELQAAGKTRKNP